MTASRRRAAAFVFLTLVLAGVVFKGEIAADPLLPPQSVVGIIPDSSALASWLNQLDPDRLMAHVEALQNCFTRYVNAVYAHPGRGIGAAYDYINGQFQAIQSQYPNVLVWSQAFSLYWEGKQSTPQNVILTIPGSDPNSGMIVIGAHYDSIQIGFASDAYAPAPGADDNASGVAALIEMARILSGTRHRATITLVAFAAEEIGRKGSQAFVHDYVDAQHIPVTAMINLDIIGSATGINGNIDNHEIRLFSAGPVNSPSRQLARELQIYADFYFPAMQVIVQDTVDRQSRYGDHMSFSDAGYAAVRFISALENEYHEHTSMDRMQDVNPFYLQHSSQTILAAVIAFADGLPAPSGLNVVGAGDSTTQLSWIPEATASSYVIAFRQTNSLIYDQTFEVTTPPLDWSSFATSGFAGFVVAAKDANGMIGQFSQEYPIT